MKDKILEILSNLRPEFDFTSSSNFIDDGLLDSFDIVSLVTELEEQYDVSIDGEDIMPENFSSVEAIIELIEKSEQN